RRLKPPITQCATATSFVCRSGDLVEQPGPGMCPIIFRRSHRSAQRFGGFIMREANEVTQLHHFGFERMRGCELVKRPVYGKALVVVAGERQLHLLQLHSLLAAAMSHGALLPGAVNEK